MSEMLGNAQLLCEKGGVSVFLLCLHTGGTVFVVVCMHEIAIFLMHVFILKCVCICSHRLSVQRAYLLLCNQFSWTQKLVQFCGWLYLDWLREDGVGEAISG